MGAAVAEATVAPIPYTIVGMSMQLTVTLSDELAARAVDAATTRGETLEALTVGALTSVLDENRMAGRPNLSFVGIGTARPDLAEAHREILEGHLGTGL